MPTHQVGFHNNREVRKYKVEKRSTEIVNRMEKTKQERHPDLAEERLVGGLDGEDVALACLVFVPGNDPDLDCYYCACCVRCTVVRLFSVPSQPVQAPCSPLLPSTL